MSVVRKQATEGDEIDKSVWDSKGVGKRVGLRVRGLSGGWRAERQAM